MARGKARSKENAAGVSRFTEYDVYLFKQGLHTRLFDKLGAHLMEVDGVKGAYFAVWAPNAARVSVIGDFNDWSADTQALQARQDGSGVWEGFAPAVAQGNLYKYRIVSRTQSYEVDKADPFAFYCEKPPRTGSVVWDLSHNWADGQWLQARQRSDTLNAPWSVYEVHLGSWQRVPEENNRSLSYRELAERLTAYVHEMGFTHVEFMPVTEHPFYGSWGYQTTGYFAPTARYGTPQEFMLLVDELHRNGIGVVLDWVPSHFPADEHGLAYFDGTHLFEHADPKQGFHPEWNSSVFNYGRNEVRSILASSAVFWLDKYHIDGLRVDAVASMLYLDYGRKAGEWIPNRFGGRENIEAIEFLRALNGACYEQAPGIQTIAEESTAWPMVSRPNYVGGLGFGMKWNMGWMHDVLSYFANDPVYRKYHHDQLTFSIWYAFQENFVLPLSHDEVVYGKGSLLNKMPGDEWQRFANLRLLLGYMYGHPGKKLLFMGAELAQWREWNHEQSLDWHLLGDEKHHGVQRWLQDLNNFYRGQPALYERDFQADGFEWVEVHDWEQSTLAFMRKGNASEERILIVCNFTPLPRHNYRVGVPQAGMWQEALNSDATLYGGSGHGNLGGAATVPVPSHGHYHSLSLTLPPLGIVFFKHTGEQNGAI